MASATRSIVPACPSLIHFYFVPPAPQLSAGFTDDPGRPPEPPAVRPARLLQRWTRNPAGAVVPCWELTERG